MWDVLIHFPTVHLNYFRVRGIYPTTSRRWGHAFSVPESSQSIILFDAWTVKDLTEVVKYFLASPIYTKIQKVDKLGISISEKPVASKSLFPRTWQRPSPSEWSQTVWTNLLQTLPSSWGSEGLFISVPDTGPLRGLLGCLHHEQFTHGRPANISAVQTRTRVNYYQKKQDILPQTRTFFNSIFNSRTLQK